MRPFFSVRGVALCMFRDVVISLFIATEVCAETFDGSFSSAADSAFRECHAFIS